MPPELDGLRFETACGVYRLEHLMEPQKDIDSNRWEYWLQFKWIDPHDETNKATPEYRLYLDLYEEDMIANDAEAKLIGALNLWIQSAPFHDSGQFSFRSAENPCLKQRAMNDA
jgi:hypothetical protein